MKFEKAIKEMLEKVVDDCNGNKTAAAEKLGIKPVTFLLWTNGKRRPVSEVICKAIDATGAYLVLGGKKDSTNIPKTAEYQSLESENLRLFKETVELRLELDKQTIRAETFKEAIQNISIGSISKLPEIKKEEISNSPKTPDDNKLLPVE